MAEFRLSSVLLILAVFLAVLVNGDFLASLRKLWTPSTTASTKQTTTTTEGSSGRSFSSRGGYYDGGDPYMMSAASQRGWGGGGGGGWGGGWGHDDHQNLDLYSLLGGLSFASLLGATIIYLARRNTSGRRRRSADGLSYLEDDELDFSEDPQTKGLNIVEMLDTFLDNRHILFANDEQQAQLYSNGSVRSGNGSSDPVTLKKPSSIVRSFIPQKVHLGPGIMPHQLKDPVF